MILHVEVRIYIPLPPPIEILNSFFPYLSVSFKINVIPRAHLVVLRSLHSLLLLTKFQRKISDTMRKLI